MLVVKGGDLFIQRYVIDIINTLPYSVLIHPTDEFFQVHDAPAFPQNFTSNAPVVNLGGINYRGYLLKPGAVMKVAFNCFERGRRVSLSGKVWGTPEINKGAQVEDDGSAVMPMPPERILGVVAEHPFVPSAHRISFGYQGQWLITDYIPMKY